LGVFRPLVLHGVQGLVCRVEEGSDGVGFARIAGNSQTYRKRRRLAVGVKEFTNSPCYQCGRAYAGLRQDYGKLVTTVACRGIDGPAAVSQDLSQSAEGPVSHQMTKLIVDLLQSVEIQQ